MIRGPRGDTIYGVSTTFEATEDRLKLKATIAHSHPSSHLAFQAVLALPCAIQ